MADLPLFIEVNGTVLHAVQSGSGTGAPVVFLNSLGSDVRLWAGVASRLTGRPLLRFDQRGHGLSDAPEGEYTLQDLSGDLLGLLNALRLERAVLVGVSVGGMVAQDFARRWPDRVAGLVLCDTGLNIGSAHSWAERMAAIQSGGMETVAGGILARWFTPGFLASQPEQVRGYRNMLGRTPAVGYLGTCAALRDADLRGCGPLGMPTLILCGEQDLSTPPELSRDLAAELGAPLHLIADAAHLPCTEQPEAVAEHLQTFLDGLEATSAVSSSGDESRYERGMKMRRAVLGDEHVDRATNTTTEFDREFQVFITEYAWGGPWSRGHLDLRTRHLVTLAVLAALPREHELSLHLRATVNTGVTPEDLRELFMQVAVYAGVPLGNRAYGLAKDMLAAREGQ